MDRVRLAISDLAIEESEDLVVDPERSDLDLLAGHFVGDRAEQVAASLPQELGATLCSKSVTVWCWAQMRWSATIAPSQVTHARSSSARTSIRRPMTAVWTE